MMPSTRQLQAMVWHILDCDERAVGLEFNVVESDRSDVMRVVCARPRDGKIVSVDIDRKRIVLSHDAGIVKLFADAIEYILTVFNPPRPPKGWRLFGRRPRAVLA